MGMQQCQLLFRDLEQREREEYGKLRNGQNGIDEKTFQLTLKYYLEYRHNAHISPEKIQLIFKSALFMAEKSQFTTNIKGERITMPSQSLGQLLRSHPLDEVMITLKEFSKCVPVSDKQASSELTNLIKEISFLITFHKKFEKSVERLELKERNPESGSDYLKMWSSYSWLLYVLAKDRVLGKSLDLIENTCMLAQTIAFMISFAWDYILPSALLKNQKRVNEQSSSGQIVHFLRDRIMQMFSIKSMDVFANVANSFQAYFDEQLVQKGLVKVNSQKMDFLSCELLPHNYRRLDKHYQRNMNPNGLDQRIFFKDRTSNLTPSKFTPFARQGYANKGRRAGNTDLTLQQNFNSHRILNYQLNDKQQPLFKELNGAPNFNKLPKTLIVSPSTMRVPLICSTPITAGMDMFNYITEKVRKFNQIYNKTQPVKRNFQNQMRQHIQNIYQKCKNQFDKKTKDQRLELIYSLYKLGIEQFLTKSPNEKDNQQLFRSMVALSVEMVLFVTNSPLTFQNVQNQLNADPLQLWRACDFFLKFDKAMPSNLKLHLLDLQVNLISYKIWKDKKIIQFIHNFANGEKIKDPIQNDIIQRLFRRLLHQTAFQIQHLGHSLALQDSLHQCVFDTMKQIFCDCTSLLLDHHIDQMIMCSFFYNCRLAEMKQFSFQNMTNIYQTINPHNKDIHSDIIFQIQPDKKNLIHYYNNVFIPQIKKYLKNPMRNSKSSINSERESTHNTCNPLLMSPLKDILPREMNKKNRVGNTNLLIAYNDSPLLKHEPIALRGQKLHSKKIINFEEEEQQFNLKNELKEQDKNISHQTSNQNIRKCKLPGNVIAGQSNGQLNFGLKPPSSMVPTPSRVKSNPISEYQIGKFIMNPSQNQSKHPVMKAKGRNY